MIEEEKRKVKDHLKAEAREKLIHSFGVFEVMLSVDSVQMQDVVLAIKIRAVESRKILFEVMIGGKVLVLHYVECEPQFTEGFEKEEKLYGGNE